MRLLLPCALLLGLLLVAATALAQDENPGSSGGSEGGAPSADKMRDDAVKALMGEGSGDTKKAKSGSSGKKAKARQATDTTPSDTLPAEPAPKATKATKGSKSTRTRGGVPDNSVPVVPSAPSTAPPTAAPATTQDILPPENIPATPAATAPPSADYRAAPTEDAQPLNPPAENEPAPAATAAPAPAGASSAIIIGLIVLAILLVILAAVVGVMAANRAGPAAAGGRAAGAVAAGLAAGQTRADWGYLTAPEAPHISLQQTPFLMGSAAECSLRLADPKAAPHHARIDRTPEGYVLTDLHSTSGTFLNGERITDAVSLRPGDEVRMGDIVVNFEMHA